MKQFIIILCIYCCGASQLLCDDAVSPANLNAIDELLESIVKSPSYPGKQYRETVLDGPFREIPQFVALSKLISETHIDPKSLMRLCESNFDKQVVLVYSLVDVNGDRYLDFGNTLLERLMLHNLDNDLFVLGYLMPSNRKRWFFTSNYTDPQVKEYLQKVRAAFPINSDVQFWLDNVLSGKLAERDRRLLAENPNLAKEVDTLGNDEYYMKRSARPLSKQHLESSNQNTETSKRTSPTGENPFSSLTPWGIIVALIVAAIGLLWLLLKGRK